MIWYKEHFLCALPFLELFKNRNRRSGLPDSLTPVFNTEFSSARLSAKVRENIAKDIVTLLQRI